MDISTQISQIIHSRPGAPIMEWQKQWWSCGQLAAFDNELEAKLCQLGIEPDMAVGLVARNRPAQCFAFLSLLANARRVSMLYALQSAEALAGDLHKARFAAVLLEDELDWNETLAQAAEATGTPILLLGALPENGIRVIMPGQRSDHADVHRLPCPGIEILSSGTTGAPKRVFHPSNLLFRSIAGTVETRGELPEIVHWPLGGIGGTLNLAGAVVKHVPFVLFERFKVEDVVDAIKRHRLGSIALTPAMVRMLYDADVPPEDLSSIIAFFGGSGPLDPVMQDKFEARYGKPIIWAMGATEFCGTVMAWSLDLHKAYGKSKRGSAGRMLPGCHGRITDPETREELPRGELGLLEVKVDAVGPDWIRTTDLALIDEDDFVFLKGRNDGAINRGGFKVIPEKVCEALRLHPAVSEAAVVGVNDDRLGEVPVAVIERRPGAMVTSEDIEKHLRALLATPQIPVRSIFVDRLPYTASTKVNLGEVRKLVAAAQNSFAI